MNISPEELREESSQERVERERKTGVFGNGHVVSCHPTGDPEVFEKKHRVVCLTRPYAACGGCRHAKFKLVFNADPNAALKTVKCPRWAQEMSRIRGEQPDHYVETEVKTCSEKPFPFCPSCPSLENLSKMYIDKTKDSWYARFIRFKKEEEDSVE